MRILNLMKRWENTEHPSNANSPTKLIALLAFVSDLYKNHLFHKCAFRLNENGWKGNECKLELM